MPPLRSEEAPDPAKKGQLRLRNTGLPTGVLTCIDSFCWSGTEYSVTFAVQCLLHAAALALQARKKKNVMSSFLFW